MDFSRIKKIFCIITAVMFSISCGDSKKIKDLEDELETTTMLTYQLLEDVSLLKRKKPQPPETSPEARLSSLFPFILLLWDREITHRDLRAMRLALPLLHLLREGGN